LEHQRWNTIKIASTRNITLYDYDNDVHATTDWKRNEDVETIIAVAKRKISTQFNEILPALSIFQKHWPTLDDTNRSAILKYMKVLIILCAKARAL
jgi:hypothetical protein